MIHHRDSYLRIRMQLACLLSAGLAACDQPANEKRSDEPQPAMHGKAGAAVELGGEAVRSALCFSKRAPYHSPSAFEKLTPDARAALDPQYSAFEQSERNDRVAVWMPSGQREIVEVETVGHFPSEFEIDEYVAPSADFVKPLFEGEPPMAEGSICAVRVEHPHVVHKPLLLTAHDRRDKSDGPQTLYYAWLDDDTDAYYLETWRCPSPGSPQSECGMTSDGDPALMLNSFGTFVKADAEPIVVYLAEPAAPDSYTAWKYGAHEGLSAGFHLFRGPRGLEAMLERNKSAEPCRSAEVDAFNQICEELAGDFDHTDLGPLTVTDVQSDPILNDAYQRRIAELTMERCEPLSFEPLSVDESVAITFSSVARPLPLWGR